MHKVTQDLHEQLLRRFLYERDLEKGCKIDYEFIHELDIIKVTYISKTYDILGRNDVFQNIHDTKLTCQKFYKLTHNSGQTT